ETTSTVIPPHQDTLRPPSRPPSPTSSFTVTPAALAEQPDEDFRYPSNYSADFRAMSMSRQSIERVGILGIVAEADRMDVPVEEDIVDVPQLERGAGSQRRSPIEKLKTTAKVVGKMQVSLRNSNARLSMLVDDPMSPTTTTAADTSMMVIDEEPAQENRGSVVVEAEYTFEQWKKMSGYNLAVSASSGQTAATTTSSSHGFSSSPSPGPHIAFRAASPTAASGSTFGGYESSTTTSSGYGSAATTSTTGYAPTHPKTTGASATSTPSTPPVHIYNGPTTAAGRTEQSTASVYRLPATTSPAFANPPAPAIYAIANQTTPNDRYSWGGAPVTPNTFNMSAIAEPSTGAAQAAGPYSGAANQRYSWAASQPFVDQRAAEQRPAASSQRPSSYFPPSQMNVSATPIYPPSQLNVSATPIYPPYQSAYPSPKTPNSPYPGQGNSRHGASISEANGAEIYRYMASPPLEQSSVGVAPPQQISGASPSNPPTNE
ncbi:hypothetical protein HDU93_004947, partial [Gonapodya sp. JEL0774]